MSVGIKKNSRLQAANLLIVGQFEFWDMLVLPDSTPRSDDIIHLVSQSDRIDLIAYRYYQDATLWWAIAWANNLEILPSDLKENSRIRIPSRDFISNVLTRRPSRR